MKKINLFFILSIIICLLLTSCSADTAPKKSAPKLPNAFTADIAVSYNGTNYSGQLRFDESSASVLFSSPDGLNGIIAQYTPNGLYMEYKDTSSVPNARAIPDNGALSVILKNIGGAFRTASETQITDTYYIYKNSSGALYVNTNSETPEYLECADFKITFGNFKAVQ